MARGWYLSANPTTIQCARTVTISKYYHSNTFLCLMSPTDEDYCDGCDNQTWRSQSVYSSCCSQAKDCMSYEVYSSYQYLANLLSRCSYLNMGWVRSMSRYQGYKRIIDNETSQWAILFHEEVSTKRWVTCFCGGVGLGGEPTWSIGTPTLTNVGCKYTSISQIKCLSVHHTLRIKLATTLPLARKATGTLWLSYVDLLCKTYIHRHGLHAPPFHKHKWDWRIILPWAYNAHFYVSRRTEKSDRL